MNKYGMYEDKPEGRELMIPFPSKLGCCSNESIIPYNSRIIIIVIAMSLIKCWGMRLKHVIELLKNVSIKTAILQSKKDHKVNIYWTF